MALLILFVLFTVIVSFLCSIMEAVILSITPSFIARLEQNNHPIAKQVRKLKASIDRPLAAILSLNTIANTMGAAGAGAQAALVFGNAAVGVFSAVFTFLILVFSEIIPKTLGAMYWRKLAFPVVRFLSYLIKIMWMLVKMSQGITYLLARNRDVTTFSREEFTALAEIGKREGVFEENESRILKNLFRFGSILVKDIMTPRTVVYALPGDIKIEEVMSQEEQEFTRFSRIILYGEKLDIVIGYVLKDHILLKAAQGEESLTLKSLAREITVVPESMALSALFERLTGRIDHIALVIDEYGGFAGIVTMEDIVETLLGMEIMDEEDTVRDMQELARQQWLKRAKRLGLVSEHLDEFTDHDSPSDSVSVTPSSKTD